MDEKIDWIEFCVVVLGNNSEEECRTLDAKVGCSSHPSSV